MTYFFKTKSKPIAGELVEIGVKLGFIPTLPYNTKENIISMYGDLSGVCLTATFFGIWIAGQPYKPVEILTKSGFISKLEELSPLK